MKVATVPIPKERPPIGPGLPIWDMAQEAGLESLTLWTEAGWGPIPRKLRRAILLVDVPTNYVNVPVPQRDIAQAVADALGVEAKFEPIPGTPFDGWRLNPQDRIY